jgi:hypothetical protein
MQTAGSIFATRKVYVCLFCVSFYKLEGAINFAVFERFQYAV